MSASVLEPRVWADLLADGAEQANHALFGALAKAESYRACLSQAQQLHAEERQTHAQERQDHAQTRRYYLVAQEAAATARARALAAEQRVRELEAQLAQCRQRRPPGETSRPDAQRREREVVQ